MKARREEVVANLKRLKEECLPLLTVLEDQEKVKQLRTDKQFTFPILAEQYQARPPARRPRSGSPVASVARLAAACGRSPHHTSTAASARPAPSHATRLACAAPHRSRR